MMAEEVLHAHWLKWFGDDTYLRQRLEHNATMRDGYDVDDATNDVRAWVMERVAPAPVFLDVVGDTLSMVLFATNWTALAKALLIKWHIQAVGIVFV